MPVTLDPTNDLIVREIERRSNLSKQLISSIEWIKPANHCKPEQKVAFATIQINNNEDANKAICNGLIIEGKRVSLNKAQPDPSWCYNCHTYPKPFHLAKDCPNNSRCSTCGDEHPTHNTHDCPITNLADQFCVSCNTKEHPSWSCKTA